MRQHLSEILHEFSDNVYFQPPSNVLLKYPCIIYEFVNVHRKRADNINYMMKRKYEVKYISKSPDPLGPHGEKGFVEEFLDRFQNEPSANVSFQRRFISDGLYHDVFYIYI